MTRKRDLLTAVLSCFCLAAVLFAFIGTNSSLPYDPWADLNADGAVDMKDISYSAKLFGTSGDPTKMVIIEGYNCSATSYTCTVPAKQAANLNIDTAGYKQITLGFSSSRHLDFAAGFQIGNKYVNVDRFSIGLTPHIADAFWIEPSSINLGADAHGIGYKFNVTVWLNLTSKPTGYCYAWQFGLLYEKAYLNCTKAGYTAGSKSVFFEDVELTYSVDPVLASPYNSTHNEFLYGESATGSISNARPVPGYGSLAWIEFEVMALPPEGTSHATSLEFYTDMPPTPTFVWDGGDVGVYYYPYVWNCLCSINWLPTLPEYDIARTYAITGRTLTIRCYNPNDYDITDLTIDVYLTS